MLDWIAAVLPSPQGRRCPEGADEGLVIHEWCVQRKSLTRPQSLAPARRAGTLSRKREREKATELLAHRGAAR